MKTLKSYISPLLGAVVLVAGMLIMPGLAARPIPAAAQANQPTATPTPNASTTLRTVTVSGNGSVDAVPDIATVNLGVQTQAATARDALTQNNTQMQALINALENAGVANKDVQTQTFNIQPNYKQDTNGTTSTVTGYTVTNSVQVTVRNLANMGSLLDAAVTAGSNQVNGITFDFSNPSQLTDQARTAAMQDAQHKAQQLAQQVNATLGPVVSINENSQQPIPYNALRMSAQASVPVQPGSQSVQVNVQVTWELVVP